MKRQATPEQKAKRAEKIAKMRQLAKVIGDMDDAQRQRLIDAHPIVTIEGRALSPKNQCMIAMQLPRATVVGGFRQWLTAGRSVKKGEHGACIWIPIGTGRPDESADPGAEPQSGDRQAFTLGTVFDIAQTEPKEAAEVTQERESLALEMEVA